jgi:hypothetical protein
MVASLRAQASSYEKAFDEWAADPPLRFREWVDSELAELIARNPDTAAARMAASEIRRREAWQTPAKWALIVSLFSFGVAAWALIRTL